MFLNPYLFVIKELSISNFSKLLNVVVLAQIKTHMQISKLKKKIQYIKELSINIKETFPFREAPVGFPWKAIMAL